MLELTLWYIGLGLKKYLNYFNGLGLVSWYTWVTLEKYLDYLAFGLTSWYAGLVLEKHWNDLLNSDSFYYNQAGMPLEKS